jgi:hypothetical protein
VATRGSAVLLGALLATACGAAEPSQEGKHRVLPDSVFAAIYVELRVASLESVDREAFEARKREILEAHDADEAALEVFAWKRGGDVEAMARLWRQIEADLEERLTPPEPARPADRGGTPDPDPSPGRP